ncbi:MAG TPA: hypothetical protein VJ184_02170 [Chryseolinea sp.]|nr:hypothetical protein [Chryseolinea sp.]
MNDGVKDSDQWECEYCRNKKLVEKRNCGGKYKASAIKVFDKVFTQCPLSDIDRDSIELYNLVMICEGGGMGGSRVMPSQLIEETNFYFSARTIIFDEKRKIDKYRKKKEKH